LYTSCVLGLRPSALFQYIITYPKKKKKLLSNSTEVLVRKASFHIQANLCEKAFFLLLLFLIGGQQSARKLI
jgi:hypothetical protein